VPRTNTPQSDTPTRPRSRSSARSSSQRTADAAADRSTSSSATATSEGVDDPSYDEIAEAAYHRYLRRGGIDGQDFDDWVEAERELKSRRSS